MMLTEERKRLMDYSDLYCNQQELISPVSQTRSPLPPRKRPRCQLFPDAPFECPAPSTSRENPFHSLPDEMLKHVFSFLRKSDLRSCMATSRRFYRVATDRDLWHSADYYQRKLAEPAVLTEILRGSRIVRASSAASLVQLPAPVQLPELPLQMLDLTSAMVSKHLLTSLLTACRGLRKLSLENQSLNDTICRAIANNRRLDTLNLCMASGLSADGITVIMENCEQLQSLNVSWSTMDAASLSRLVAALPRTLVALNVSGYSQSFRDHHMLEICQRCPQLQLLGASDNRNLSPTAVLHVVQNCLQLTHLDISRSHLIWPEHTWILGDLPKLRHLSCFGFPDQRMVEEVRRGLPENVQVNGLTLNTSSIARPHPSIGVSREIWGVPLR